jgi:type II secretory pathway pseudopilin PulG
MRARLASEGGFSLVEVLVAMGLMILILGATLTSFNAFEKTNRTNQLQNDNQENVRSAMDQIARELRNHATPTPESPLGIDKATSYDLVFQTVDKTKPAGSQNVRNVRRVRYCLDASDPGNAKLYVQTQTWTTANPPAAKSTATCPDPAWGNQKVLADQITNQVNAQDRAAFIANSGTLADITRMRIDLWVDINPGTQGTDRPGEARLTTGVFFRNQNRAPVATFTGAPTADGHILLNASATTDPDNDRMTYVWCDGACNGSNEVGRGLTFAYFPDARGLNTVGLKVTDTAGLAATATQDINVP